MTVANSSAETSAQQSPSCPQPAPIEGNFDAKAPNLIVQFKSGFEPYATAHMLAEKYHFKVSWVFAHAISGFSIRDIDVSLMPQLQCEPSIKTLSFDASTTIS